MANNLWMLDRFRRFFRERTAIEIGDRSINYVSLADIVTSNLARLEQNKIGAGDTVVILGDFSEETIGLILAAAMWGCVVVPLDRSSQESLKTSAKVLSPKAIFDFTADLPRITLSSNSSELEHPLIGKLKTTKNSGLILFSSGSSGKPKIILLNFSAMIAKFEQIQPKPYKTLSFLLFDHIGGINTMLNVLMNGGTLIPAGPRTSADICKLIEQKKVELLPTTPTFLKMLLVNKEYCRFDLSSLRLITYGTEPMSNTTLEELVKVFPEIRFKQTYGSSEFGILPTKTEESDSLWMKIGGADVDYKVIDNILWIKTSTVMLGYLNHDYCVDDGWYCTGDAVEVSDKGIKVLGRVSDIINVGGLKVYPVEIEKIVHEIEEVKEVKAWGKKNAVVGQVVALSVKIDCDLDETQMRKKITEYCRSRLEDYKVPRLITFVTNNMHSERFKKVVNA